MRVRVRVRLSYSVSTNELELGVFARTKCLQRAFTRIVRDCHTKRRSWGRLIRGCNSTGDAFFEEILNIAFEGASDEKRFESKSPVGRHGRRVDAVFKRGPLRQDSSKGDTPKLFEDEARSGPLFLCRKWTLSFPYYQMRVCVAFGRSPIN